MIPSLQFKGKTVTFVILKGYLRFFQCETAYLSNFKSNQSFKHIKRSQSVRSPEDEEEVM